MGEKTNRFISKIKKVKTDELIYALSRQSIEMYKNDMAYSKGLPVAVSRFGFYERANVTLTAWDIPSIIYHSIKNSNDYRNGAIIASFPEIVNAYRGYEDEKSVSQFQEHGNTSKIFQIIMGMTAEQFQYQSLGLILEKLNRTYHILFAAKNYEHRYMLDANAAVKNVLGFSAKEYLAIVFIVWWLCSKHPDPLSAPEEIYKKHSDSVLTKENITKFIKCYSSSYEEIRKSQFGHQILYSKPFILTDRKKEYLSSSVYLVQLLLGNGLYWLVRDYYREKQKFTNAFGYLFEDYIKELANMYCEAEEWQVIPQSKEPGADFIFELGKIKLIVESKASLLKLDAKQQVPNLESSDDFFNKIIKESYGQLNATYVQFENKTQIYTIKIILLYDDFSNSSIIEMSIPEIFEKDPNCFIMSIREFEILLYLKKNDKNQFDLIVNTLLQTSKEDNSRKSISGIYKELKIEKNSHFYGERDYVSKIIERLKIDLTEAV